MRPPAARHARLGGGVAIGGVTVTVNVLFWVVAGTAALSCFFALVSYSLRAYRRVQLEDSSPEADSPKPERIRALERNLTGLRLTASFCRAAANLGLAVATVYLFEAPTHGAGRLSAALVTACAVVAVFGVAVPQAWATHAGDRVLRATLGILTALRYALWPVSRLMEWFDLPIRRLSGVHDDAHANGDAARLEILHAATEGQAEGAVDAEDVEMIESVIEFGERTAGEIMTPRTDIFALPVHTPWGEAAAKLVEAGHTRVPVYESDIDNIVGILYAKDLLRHIGSEGPSSLREVSRKCYFVPETKRLDDLLAEFKARKVHLAVVLDEYGGTAGIVTIEDVIEEIVGDISDEYDRVSPALMKRLDERTAEADGRLHIDDLNDALRLEIPEDEDYDTVAGMVFSELGFIPTPGEQLEAYGARFTVLGAEERRITRLRVEVLEPHQADSPP